MVLLMLLPLSSPEVAGETAEGRATSRDSILDILQLGTVDGEFKEEGIKKSYMRLNWLNIDVGILLGSRYDVEILTITFDEGIYNTNLSS